MGSFQSPKQFYSPEDLNELEWLFDSVWALFNAQHPTRDKLSDQELKTNLRRTLFALTCSGNFSDEDELRAHLLASVAGPREAGRLLAIGLILCVVGPVC